MTVLAYLTLLCLTLALAATLDEVWLLVVRPRLAESRGWPEVQPDERIPAVAWAGAGAFLSVLFIFLPLVGVSAGY